MFTEIQTYILYNILLLLCPTLCFLSERKNTRWGIFLAYAILMAVSIFRFDIGDDYVRYASMFNEVGKKTIDTITPLDMLMYEPLTFLLSWTFSWAIYPYVYVMGCYAFATLFCYYKIFDHYKIHSFGVFFLVATWMLFQAWDGVRQNLAIAIFVYGIRFIESRDFLRYLICLLFAMTAHYSAILMLPFYFVSYIKLDQRILTGIVFVVFVLAEIGFLSNMHNSLAALIPYYGQIYADSKYLQNGSGTYHTTTYILTMLLYMLILFLSKKGHSIFANLLAIGAIIYAEAGGNLTFIRISWYFTPALMILVPKILQEASSVMEYNKTYVRYLYMIVLFVSLFEGVYLKANFRNVVPYDSVFLENFHYQRFRFRE